MAASKCPKCETTSLEIAVAAIPVRMPPGAEPRLGMDGRILTHGHPVEVALVQCQGCGCVVGTLDGDNAADVVRKLAKKLNVSL